MDQTFKKCPVILQTGFRIFFLGAAAYAVVSMVYWFQFYVAGGNIFVAMPLTVWHGHEMVFGFTMAVVAGFLLTAVTNWTGLPTLSGKPLLILFLFWFFARVLALMSTTLPAWPAIVCNLTFVIFLAAAGLRPIIVTKRWKQSAVFSKVILIFLSMIVLYSALAQANLITERKALRFAVYMIISLIFTITRRIMPFFVERGVGYDVTLRNSKVVDIVSLIFLVTFSIADVFWPQPIFIAFLCVVLSLVHFWRLAGWYTPGILKRPLLWVLFAGYLFLIAGFILKTFSVVNGLPDDAALHAWTAGGIGIFTLGMMARVSWGHTGRNIAQPPRLLSLMFVLIIASAIVRVFFPLVDELHYILWIGASQILWMFAFGLYLVVYFEVLTSPRPDGERG